MRILIFLLFLQAALSQPSPVSPDTVVLTVHNRQYTRAEFEEILRAQNADPREVAGRLSKAEGFARVRALAEIAKRRNLDQLPAVRAKIEIYQAAVLNQALFDDILAEIRKDESLARNHYESRQHSAEERRLRHILIRHEQSRPVAGKLTPEQALNKARALGTQIVGGVSFAEVAKRQSDDEKTKTAGGDLNFIRKPLLVPEFGEAAFRLKQGEISEPVKTLEGYHLILVEKIAPPAFELVRKSIEYELARERMDQIAVSGIKLNPDYFGH